MYLELSHVYQRNLEQDSSVCQPPKGMHMDGKASQWLRAVPKYKTNCKSPNEHNYVHIQINVKF